VKQHFANRTVIGMHIRAGNGEEGDFTQKKREIKDGQQALVESTSKHIRELARQGTDPSLLFIATDTPSYVEAFRLEPKDAMPVVDLPQTRPSEGSGVLFGGPKAVVQRGESCLVGRDLALQDMMIISMTDIVLATKPSSFVQTMPMSMVLGNGKRKFGKPTVKSLTECIVTDLSSTGVARASRLLHLKTRFLIYYTTGDSSSLPTTNRCRRDNSS
jgi:hypothetical protein